jgi:hypothetical protein
VSAQRGIPANAYVIGAAMFFLSMLVVLGSELVRRRRVRG